MNINHITGSQPSSPEIKVKGIVHEWTNPYSPRERVKL